MDRFDLEQQILACWSVVDDLDLMFEHAIEGENFDRDQIANLALGLKELYSLKFQKLFSTFEELVAKGEITSGEADGWVKKSIYTRELLNERVEHPEGTRKSYRDPDAPQDLPVFTIADEI